jgi:hypothetical protein
MERCADIVFCGIPIERDDRERYSQGSGHDAIAQTVAERVDA